MKTNSKARLIIASSENCADLYWATKFYVPDPIVFIEHRGRKILVASDLEVSRARKEADVDQVLSSTHYENQLKKSGRQRKRGDVLDAILKERKIRTLEVPSDFPIREAENLRQFGYRLEIASDPYYPARAIKTQEEKKSITQALRMTEAGIQAAIDVLRNSKIQKPKKKNGNLPLFWNGSPLTSEILRSVIERTMMEKGALGQHTIVACGSQAADPHCRGTGALYANQTIVMDVFPKSMKTGYYGDITRTVVKGRASDDLKRMYAAVKKSQENGIRAIHAGVDAAKVHAKVSQTLVDAGFETGIVNGKPQGFIHSTGHGLGLEIHEAPRVSRISETLKAGHVVTVEPGLYYEDKGGIRIEDVVFVTRTGCEVLTRLPKVFEIA